MILDQNRAVLFASVVCFQKIFGLHGLNHQIIEYWVRRGRYWLVLGGTGSKQGGTGCQCGTGSELGGNGCQYDILSGNKLFRWSKAKLLNI